MEKGAEHALLHSSMYEFDEIFFVIQDLDVLVSCRKNSLINLNLKLFTKSENNKKNYISAVITISYFIFVAII